MTPEERRTRVEHVVKMAELGVLAEPAYDREAWLAQEEAGELPDVESPEAGRGTPPAKPGRRRTA